MLITARAKLPPYQARYRLQLTRHFHPEQGLQVATFVLLQKKGPSFPFITGLSMPTGPVKLVAACSKRFTISADLTEGSEQGEEREECTGCIDGTGVNIDINPIAARQHSSPRVTAELEKEFPQSLKLTNIILDAEYPNNNLRTEHHSRLFASHTNGARMLE